MPIIKSGFTGALGALGLDALWQFSLPYVTGSWYTPVAAGQPDYMGTVFKLLGAIGIGMLGGKIVRGHGRDLAVGAATVAIHDCLKATLETSLPTTFGPGGSVSLGGFGAYLSGSAPIVGTATWPQTNVARFNFSNPGVGAYLSGSGMDGSGAGMFVDDHMGYGSSY